MLHDPLEDLRRLSRVSRERAGRGHPASESSSEDRTFRRAGLRAGRPGGRRAGPRRRVRVGSPSLFLISRYFHAACAAHLTILPAAPATPRRSASAVRAASDGAACNACVRGRCDGSGRHGGRDERLRPPTAHPRGAGRDPVAEPIRGGVRAAHLTRLWRRSGSVPGLGPRQATGGPDTRLSVRLFDRFRATRRRATPP